MDFAIGQDVVHPAHGPGTIVDIEESELVAGYHRFYVIEFVRNRLTVRLPVERVSEIGVRKVMSQARYQRVLSTLRALPEQLQSDFKSRRYRVNELLHSGRPGQIAAAVRDLTWRKFEKHLTKADADQLSKGRQMLAAEVAMSNNEDVHEAERAIREAVAESVAAQQALLQKVTEAEAI
ncbi:MAG: hypothetical protein KJZ86_03020 [Caldilineaceae bacterium]|nr:hypothetical protein [Caldilineaceae bacterium]